VATRTFSPAAGVRRRWSIRLSNLIGQRVRRSEETDKKECRRDAGAKHGADLVGDELTVARASTSNALRRRHGGRLKRSSSDPGVVCG
jgi:hypothetical protein